MGDPNAILNINYFGKIWPLKKIDYIISIRSAELPFYRFIDIKE